MKKFVAIVLTLSLFLVIGAVASVAYPAVEVDDIATFDVQDDGSVIISVSKDNIEAATDYTLTGNVYITIYSEDPGFNAESDMMTPFNAAQAGVGNVGLQESYVYKVNVGESTAAQSGEYPFEDGKTYYVIFCFNVNQAAGWIWSPTPVTFVYEAPAADDEIVTGNNGYPCTNADFGVTTEVQADGSVIIGASREAINAAAVAGGLTWGGNDFVANYIYITIYDEDPGFDSNTHMTNEGPYSTPAAGNDASGAGRVDGDPFTYRITQGAADSSVPAYPFVEGQTYYVYICVNNASNAGQWLWNYEGTSFVYEIPGEEPTPTPTATATATPTATATEGATETAATTEAATTEAAATTAAAETTAAATGTQSTDDTDDGGDFSVLIYLAAALAAGGVAAFAFRKKNRA